jgi:Uma2 family endonuclease
MSSQPKTSLTAEEYLAIERKAPYKSEYHDGVMHAVAGAREAHNLIAGNVLAELRDAIRTRACRTYPSDMRVRTGAGLYAYPDVTLVCGTPEFLDERRDTLLNPNLIMEVLSPSTEGYDRGRKFEFYRAIPSLREYLMPASDRVHVDLYARQESGQWLLTSADQMDDALELAGVGCRLKLADLYEKVEF